MQKGYNGKTGMLM